MLASISRPLIFVVISFLVMGTLGLSYSTGAMAVPPERIESCKYDDTADEDLWECCWTETDPADPEQIEIYLCQECIIYGGKVQCNAPHPAASPSPTTGEDISPGVTGGLEQPPTPPSFDPTAPLQGGVLEQQEQTPPPSAGPGASPGILEQLEQGSSPELGFSERQQLQPPAEQGAAELPPPPATEQTQPAAVEEEQPVPLCQEGLEFNEDLGFCVPTECPEGQELNEETGICVLEEQPAAAQEPAQSESEEEQPQPEGEQPSEESGSEGDGSNN